MGHWEIDTLIGKKSRNDRVLLTVLERKTRNAIVRIIETETTTKVYFTHPFSSFEKGTNERNNSLLRRFIPKGKLMSNYERISASNIAFLEDWITTLPRRIFNYKTLYELFESWLALIYTA